ncbi:MAG: PAS domain S-box protein, partial [Lentisphaeria bacterium]|nr:PAS domain S-box protein [Lentisphaeria bacterium]
MTVPGHGGDGVDSGRILVVEDDSGLRGLIVKALTKAGFATEGVATGAEAVGRALADPELALLLDQRLPDMTGRDVVARLAERGLKVAFVMMTGQGDERLAVEMMKLGAADYLVKDLDLTDRLASVFGRLFHTLETERRLQAAEAALRESEARYRELVENANSVILRMDREGAITFFNEYAQQFFGYTVEEALGRNVVGTIVPETDTAGKNLRALILDIGVHPERYAANENENIRRDGTRVWMSWSNRPLYDAAGEVSEILCVATDITARKRAAEDLQAERTRFQALAESAQDGIVMIDTVGDVSFWNPAAERMFGYSAGEVLGKNLHQLLAPERYREAFGKAFSRFRGSGQGTGTGRTVELAARRQGGREIPVELSLAAMELADGWHAVGIIRDISARQEAEKKLRLQSLVLSQIQDYVTVTDLDGIIAYVNEAEAGVFGLSPEELVGASVEKYGEDPARGARQSEIIEATLRDGHWRGEVVNYASDGREYIVDCRTQVVLDERGERIALCGVSTDITERKRTEAALREGEETFRNIVQASPMGIHLYQLQADGRLVFTGANPAADKLLGVGHAQFVGRTIEEAFPALARTEVPERYRRVAEHGETWHTEQINNADGEIEGAYE